MFKSSQNLRLAAEMRALERVAAPWREARTTWFDGTPESIEARLAATDRVLTFARSGYTEAHMALEREAAAARAELREASHRLMVDFLDDGARSFKGSKRVAGTSRNAPGGVNDRQRFRDLDDTARNSFDKWLHGQPVENFAGARGSDMLEMFHDYAKNHDGDYDALFNDDAQRDALYDHLVNRFGSRRVAGDGMSYEDTMSHIDKVLAEGEGHQLHNHPGTGSHDPEFGDDEPLWAYDGDCPECGSDNIEEAENYSGKYNCYDCGGSDMTPIEGLYRVGRVAGAFDDAEFAARAESELDPEMRGNYYDGPDGGNCRHCGERIEETRDGSYDHVLGQDPYTGDTTFYPEDHPAEPDYDDHHFGSRRTAAPMTSPGEGGASLSDLAPPVSGSSVSMSVPGALAKAVANGATTTGQEATPPFNPGPKVTASFHDFDDELMF